MNWQAIAVIGQMVSAAAVVITLAFLVVQIRQNTATARIESLTTALGIHVHHTAELTATDESAALFRRSCHGFLALSLDERGRMHAAMLSRLGGFNQVARLHRSLTSSRRRLRHPPGPRETSRDQG